MNKVRLILPVILLLAGCSSDHTFYLPVADASGVKVGTPVEVKGVQIGMVKNIELSGNTAWLTLGIKPEYPLGAGATFTISTVSFLGNRAITVERTLAGTPLQSGDSLQTTAYQQSVFTGVDAAKVDSLVRKIGEAGTALIKLLEPEN